MPFCDGSQPAIARRLRVLSGLTVLAMAACRTSGSPAASPTRAPSVGVTPTGVAPPSLARTLPYADTLHGVEVPDPYRWLEDTTSVDGKAWVAAQERYADAVLARGVGRDSLTAQFARAFTEAPTLETVLDTPTGLVLTRWLGDAPSLFVAARDGTQERSLAGFDALAKGASVRRISPSRDGRLLAVATTASGDSGAAVTIVDAQTGQALPDRIVDMLTTTSGTRYDVAWLPHDEGTTPAFIYPRLWPGSDTLPGSARLSRARQYLHRVGTDPHTDMAVFGYGVSPAVHVDPDDLATRVYTAPGSAWMLGTIFRSRQNGSEHFVARRTPGDTSVPAWVPLLGVGDRGGYPLLRADTVYALVRKGADRGRVVRRVLGRASPPSGEASGVTNGAWETVVPERRGVITALAVQADALYFTERDGGAVLLHVLDARGTTRAVPLPLTGTVRLAPRAPQLDGVLVSVESWAMAPQWYQVRNAGRVVERLGVNDGAKYAPSTSLVSERLEAPSRDGTMVPVSLVYDRAALRGGRLDGTAPLLIEAYGGFGQSTDPGYDPTIEVWTSLGGVYAYAHVRGGGELGDAWHEAATREKKVRSVEDVIGVTEMLIRRGYSSPKRVAFQGISSGAGLAGLVPLMRPDLFGAVIYDVGAPDEVRAVALDPSAARNVAELGDVDTPDGVRALVAASPYHRVPTRIDHPAMLLHSARDDYNFGTEMLVGKYVARLQASHVGHGPIIWVRTTGGHRWLRSLSPEWGAAQTSFLLWQLGNPRYQPAGR